MLLFFSSFQYAVQQPEAVICDRSSPQPLNLSIHHLSAYTFDSCILMNFIDFSKPRTRQFTRVYPLVYACSLARSYSGVVTAVAGRQIYYLRHDFYFALHCCLQRVRSFGFWHFWLIHVNQSVSQLAIRLKEKIRFEMSYDWIFLTEESVKKSFQNFQSSNIDKYKSILWPSAWAFFTFWFWRMPMNTSCMFMSFDCVLIKF